MENNIAPKGKIRLYACGGAAINIAMQLASLSYKSEIMADIDIALIDTSKANLMQPNIDSYDKYLIEGLDGSGKVRALNAEPIKAALPEILHLHKPQELNIVLSSASGGSGSVIAPLLAGKLLERDQTTLALAVGGTADLTEIRNTLRTIQSYEGQVKKNNAPLALLYLQNSVTQSEAKVDETVVTTINYLAVLFSRRNHRMDTKDLKHWLRYTDVITTRTPALSAFTIVVRSAGDMSINQEIEKLGHPISVATLAPRNAITTLTNTPEYQTVGILPDMEDDGQGPNVLTGKAVYFVITDGPFPKIKAELNTKMEELEANIVMKRKQQDAVVAEVDADGMTY